MLPTKQQSRLKGPPRGDAAERRAMRLYAATVSLLGVLGVLLWGTVTAFQAAPRRVDDSVFVLLALGGMALAMLVLYLLAQLARTPRDRK